MDIVDRATRSRMMGAIRGKDTKPELVVRHVAHIMGYRFRLHRRDLPGTPDLVFPRHKVVIFVHGCFWHRHEGCRYCSSPATNTSFWNNKFRRNVERDRMAQRELTALGWRVAIIWECLTKDGVAVAETLSALFSPADPPIEASNPANVIVSTPDVVA